MPKGTRITAEKKEQIINLGKSRMTYAQIAERVGLCERAVGVVLRAANVDTYHKTHASWFNPDIDTVKQTESTVKLPVVIEKPEPIRVLSMSTKVLANGTEYTIKIDDEDVNIMSNDVLVSAKIDRLESVFADLAGLLPLIKR